jgi:PPM family protein phosphatase
LIKVDHSHLDVAAATHPGRKGKNNEDRYAITHYKVNEKNPNTAVLAVLSDGIGGHQAGEIAAQISVETITQEVGSSNASRPGEILRKAIIRASENIRQQADTDLERKGMGATCAVAWIIGSRLYTSSVGDSRIYLIRGEKIKKLTIDHTWVQEAIDFGTLSPQEAKEHPNAHVIRRYLGSQSQVVPDLRMRLKPQETDAQSEANQGLRLIQGDLILLCSDGLTDLVEDAEILAALKTRSIQHAVHGLIDLANERGGHDNITVVALAMASKRPEKEAPTAGGPALTDKKKFSLPLTLSCVGLGALLFLGLVVSGGVYWLLTQTGPGETPTATVTMEIIPLPLITATPTETPPHVSPTPPNRNPVFNTPVPTHIPTPLHPTYTPWPTSTP